MKKCPFFGKCGGCKFDFTSPDYHKLKKQLLFKLQLTDDPIWIESGQRRRADFSFVDGVFGFFQSGSKNIIPINNCPALIDELNKVLPDIANMPWPGSGSVLVTKCDNGIDVSVISSVPYFSTEFKKAADNSPAIRIIWNDKVVKQTEQPIITFDDKTIYYQPNAFLQPSKAGEKN